MPIQVHDVVHTQVITRWKERPKPVAISVHKTGNIDTIFVRKDSVIIQHDTVQVVIAREQKYYRDSLYQAWVSGINPRLDSINVAEKTIITKESSTVYKNRLLHFGLGVAAGYDPFGKKAAIVLGGTATIDMYELYNMIIKH